MDVAYKALLVVVQGPFQFFRQQLGESDDRVQRRAQLMTHAGQELAFQAIGPLHFTVAQLELLIGRRELSREGLVQRLDFLLGLLPLGDVPNDGADADAFFRLHRTQADLHRKARAVLALGVQIQAAAHGPGRGMRRIRGPVTLMPRAKVGWDQELHALSQQLGAAIAEHFFGDFVQQDDSSAGVDFQNRVGRGFEQFPKPALGPGLRARRLFPFHQFSPLLFRFAPRGDVGENHNRSLELAFFIPQRSDRRADLQRFAVPRPSQLDCLSGSLVQLGFQQFEGDGERVSDGFDPRQSEHLFSAMAPHPDHAIPVQRRNRQRTFLNDCLEHPSVSRLNEGLRIVGR